MSEEKKHDINDGKQQFINLLNTVTYEVSRYIQEDVELTPQRIRQLMITVHVIEEYEKIYNTGGTINKKILRHIENMNENFNNPEAMDHIIFNFIEDFQRPGMFPLQYPETAEKEYFGNLLLKLRALSFNKVK